jgi:hypothetical protein
LPGSPPDSSRLSADAVDAADEPYEALVAMIEHELELATEGRFAELMKANDEREALMRSLLETPPPSATAALRRAELMHTRLTMELQRRREALLLAMSELERARRAAKGYKPVTNRRPRFSSSA